MDNHQPEKTKIFRKVETDTTHMLRRISQEKFGKMIQSPVAPIEVGADLFSIRGTVDTILSSRKNSRMEQTESELAATGATSTLLTSSIPSHDLQILELIAQSIHLKTGPISTEQAAIALLHLMIQRYDIDTLAGDVESHLKNHQ